MAYGSGQSILVVGHSGREEFCILDTSLTPKPGTCVRPKQGSASYTRDGEKTVEVYGETAAAGNHGINADGDRSIIGVLLEDEDQGRTVSHTYADGNRVRVWWPGIGDELNMLYQNESGTADDVEYGWNLMIDDGNGKVMLADNNAEAEHFMALENLTDPTEDALIHCIFQGGA